MLKKRTILLTFLGLLFFSLSIVVNAQEDSVKIDTVRIENKNHSKFRKFYQKLLFKKKPTSFPIQPNNDVDDGKYQGKIIRNIYYKTQDPFGYSLQDTTKKPTRWIERAGNTLHGKSKKFVLRQNMLLKPGDRYDSVKAAESERLIRTNRSIRRVEIKEEAVGNDSVDLYVNSIDSWSMFITGSVSSSKAGIRIRERNFLGLGHVFDNRYRHNYKTGNSLYQFNYTVPNIAQTRIIGNVRYFKNEDNHYTKSISFVRPFYSPLAHYAGGVSVGQVYFKDSLDFEKPILVDNHFKYNYQDYWLARAFRIDDGHSENITNFIVSGRFYDRSYTETPTPENDPVNFFSDQTNYLVGIGISSKRYIKTKYIFNYDIEEDIAIGKSLGIIGGIQNIRQTDRYYLGGKASTGGFLNTGFWGFGVEFGGFFNKGKFEQKTLSVELQYMAKLISWGKWKFRNFMKTNYLLGHDRLDSPADQLSLHEHDYLGMEGFKSDRGLTGQQKLMFEYQLQSYTPYEFLGFRISPFFNAMVAAIGDNKKFILNNNPIYSRFSLGVMLTNDYFVFNNIRFSLSYYPSIPGQGDNLIKTNLLDNRDYQMMDFDFSKPNYIRWNRWD